MRQTLHFKIIVTSLLSIFSLLALLIYGTQVYSGLQEVDEEWREYNEDALKTNQALLSLKGAIGYGGFIHNFKNFVLRFDPLYSERLTKDIEKTLLNLDALAKLKLNDTELQALETVRATFKEYIDKIAIISQEIKNGSSQEIIDALVKVDDTKALNALETLTVSQRFRSEEKARQTQNTLDKAKKLLLMGTPIFIFIIITTAYVIRTLIKTEKMYQSQRGVSEENELLFQRAPDATLIVNEYGKIIRANKQAESLFEYDANELVGMSIEDLMPAEYREKHTELRKGYVKSPVFRPMGKATLIKAETKSKKQPILQISLSQQKNETESFTLASIRDVTESHNLQKRVDQANKLSQQAMKAKNSLLANMSHELRTPLNHIIGFSELMLHKDNLTKTQTEQVQFILESGQHQLVLIERILDLASLSDLSDVSLTGINIEVFFNEITNDFKTHHPSENMVLSYSIEDNVPEEFFASDPLLKQVFVELLSNSLKFNESDECIVKINIQTSGDFIDITLEDNGPGIKPENFELAFAAFERLDAIDKAIDGIGIGLTASRQIIEGLDGEIRFKPAKTGAKVSIRLPLR